MLLKDFPTKFNIHEDNQDSVAEENTLVEQTAPAIPEYLEYVGCYYYRDSRDGLITNIGGKVLDIDVCFSFVKEFRERDQYEYVGMAKGQTCQAGREAPPKSNKKPDTECDTKCKSLECGGKKRISVYKFKESIEANEDVEEDGPRSLNSKRSVQVKFKNASDKTVELIWFDFKGKRVSYGQIQAGQSLGMTTYVTHPWQAVDVEGSGEEHKYNINGTPIYYPMKNDQGNTIAITFADADEEITLETESKEVIKSIDREEDSTWCRHEGS